MAERNSSPARTSTGGEVGRAAPQQRMSESARSQPSGSETGSENRSTGMIDQMKNRASAQINSQKDRATDGLGTMAQAVRQSTQQLRDQQHDTVASYVEQAANQIERLSQRLKQKNVGELLSDAQRLARRQPALFVGSAFALGLIGARVMKSSPPDEQYSGAYRSQSGTSRGRGDYQRAVPATTSASGSSTAAGSSSVGRSPSTASAYGSNTENR
jgi:hypothetical protein